MPAPPPLTPAPFHTTKLLQKTAPQLMYSTVIAICSAEQCTCNCQTHRGRVVHETYNAETEKASRRSDGINTRQKEMLVPPI